MLNGDKNNFWKVFKMFSKGKCWLVAMTSFRTVLEEIWGKNVDLRLKQNFDISWEFFESKMLI